MPTITDSGNIAAVEWAEGIMTVTFLKGGVYEYYDIPFGTYNEMLAAPSKSQFLKNEVIGKFEYARV